VFLIGTNEKNVKMIDRKTLNGSMIRNQAGQGTIEYILVLTITVILILTVIWRFNTAFAKYANAFFDGYIACLLETGELPGNGGECGDEFMKFDLKNGTSLTGDGSGGGGSGGSSGGGNSNGGKNSQSSNNGKNGNGGSGGKNSQSGKNASSSGSGGSDGSGSSSGGGGTPGELGSSGGGRSIFAKNSKGRQRSTPVGNAKGAGAQAGKGREGLSALAGSDSGSSRESGGRARKTPLDRSYGYFGQEEEGEKALTAPSTVVAKDDGGADLRPKKAAVSMNRKPATVADDKDSGFSLGKFVRIILIAGIVILIVIFFGGQILQISKSAEK
jgi:hypothetical protein